MALDIAGMTPIGPIADAINAVIYLVEGDWVNAGLAVLSAVPIIGDVLGAAKIGAKYGDEALQLMDYLRGYLRETGLFAKLEGIYQSATVWYPFKKTKNLDESVEKGKDTPVVDKYGTLKNDKSIPGQAHHLNQDAAYREVIPTNEGMATKLEGNVFKDVDSPHYNAHESLEKFWDQYRRGGDKYGEAPTNLEYTKAMVDSLKAAGYSPDQAMQIANEAIKQRIQYGLLGGEQVPRIPGKINQVKR